MIESFLNDHVRLHMGDCLDVLATLADNSIDSCVTDPPYHLTSIVKRFANADPARETYVNAAPKSGYMAGYMPRAGFMGQKWDGGDIAFQPETWGAVYRVLKPGAHVIAMGGTRTYHRLVCAIEDAGFEIRDTVLWLYGSGFPKSHDVSKGIDEHFFNEWLNAHPHEREKYIEQLRQAGQDAKAREHVKRNFHKAAGLERELIGTETIRDFRNGQGREYGEGIMANMRDGSPEYYERALTSPATDAARQWEGWGTALKPACELIALARKPLSEGTVAANVLRWGTGAINVDGCRVESGGELGRWPANVVHDGGDEVTAAFPDTGDPGFGDSGSAARYFYTTKADADDRIGSKHPTIKPVDLMQYLVRLVTPKGRAVLDLFAGTGTTGEAAWREGMNAILIEREAEYCEDIRRRMKLCLAGPDERMRESIKAKNLPIDHGPLFSLWEGA